MPEKEAASLAVFASGSGSNLQALLDRFGRDGHPDSSAQVVLVVSDRPGIRALERAEDAGVRTAVLNPKEFDAPEGFAAALLAAVRESGVQLIALAGYLRLLPATVVEEFRGRIVNIHPAPLPAFGGPGMYGLRVHQAVLKSGIKISGPTAHFVDERYDTGPIIAQWPVPVLPGDDAAALAGRVLRYEHRLYPAVVRALARGEVELDAAGRVRSSAAAGEDGVGFALARETGALNSIIFLG